MRYEILLPVLKLSLGGVRIIEYITSVVCPSIALVSTTRGPERDPRASASGSLSGPRVVETKAILGHTSRVTVLYFLHSRNLDFSENYFLGQFSLKILPLQSPITLTRSYFPFWFVSTTEKLLHQFF